MDIEIVEAKDRFSVVHFGAGTGDMFTQYHCPKCGGITTVSDSKIRDSLFNDRSILPSEIIARFEERRPVRRDAWEEFYDFNCRSCHKSVRVVYIPDEFRMAAHNFILKSVIELCI